LSRSNFSKWVQNVESQVLNTKEEYTKKEIVCNIVKEVSSFIKGLFAEMLYSYGVRSRSESKDDEVAALI
jgi:hypothetical protein